MIKDYIRTPDLSKQKEPFIFSRYGYTNNKGSKDVMIKNYADKANSITYQETDKLTLRNAIVKNDLKTLRRVSREMYGSSQIYIGLVEYLSNLLCNYWVVNPKLSKETPPSDLMEKWTTVLDYIENINPEKLGATIAKKVLIDGACYIAVKEKVTTKGSTIGIQFLPNEYCKVEATYNGRDVVSFNCKFFEDKFSNKLDRDEALEIFPQCVSEKYNEWLKSKSKSKNSWLQLDPEFAFRFVIKDDEKPFYIAACIDILNLEDVKEINIYKLEQELSKILIQKFPLDKENRSALEAWQLDAYHLELAAMLGSVPGLEVVTTFADVESVDISDSNRQSVNSDSIGRAYKSIFDSAGVSQSLFNSDSAGTLGKSLILNESILINSLLAQMQDFLNTRLDVNFKKGKFKNTNFTLSMLPVTFTNRADMIKIYKEQTSLGYSKFLPAVALGQRQSVILASMQFEVETLFMDEKMIPPKSSNTTSSSESDQVGRPAKAAEDRSKKTEQNLENL